MKVPIATRDVRVAEIRHDGSRVLVHLPSVRGTGGKRSSRPGVPHVMQSRVEAVTNARESDFHDELLKHRGYRISLQGLTMQVNEYMTTSNANATAQVEVPLERFGGRRVQRYQSAFPELRLPDLQAVGGNVVDAKSKSLTDSEPRCGEQSEERVVGVGAKRCFGGELEGRTDDPSNLCLREDVCNGSSMTT